MTQYYIGLCTTYHDPALAILDQQGEVLFAEASERYLQYKRGLNCEPDSLARVADLLEEYCDLDADFVIARNWSKQRPWYEHLWSLAGYFTARGLTHSRLGVMTTYLPKYKLMHMMACQKYSRASGGISLVRTIRERYPSASIRFEDFNHHLSHAGAACYSSPYQSAACLVIDSYGDYGSSAFYRYQQGKLELIKELRGIESLGFYYMKLTEMCGFNWLKGEEWKVMGLAPYGTEHAELSLLLEQTMVVDGLEFKQDLALIRSSFERIEQRLTDGELKREDLAYAGQQYFAIMMRQLLNNFYKLGISDNLVMGGGCSLNSSFNGLILEQTPFKSLHIPSAPGDDGTALGAAYLACAKDGIKLSRSEPLSAYLGSTIEQASLQRFIQHGQLAKVIHAPHTVCYETANLLVQGALVGWVQGRAEFGARALGNRSILADPRDPGVRDQINQRVKFREEFRPFAPSILDEYGEHYFQGYQQSAYMDRTLKFKDEMYSTVAGVVHVDGTGRLQSVKREWNERYYDLIDAFYQITGVPMLLNTSFNVMGKPIMHSVEDALSVFFTSGLDVLVIEDYIFIKPGFQGQ